MSPRRSRITPPHPFFKGFSDGYQTMDTIAALNFGLVIAATLGGFGLSESVKNAPYRAGRRFCRNDPRARLYSACVYGHVLLRRLCHSGERRVDAPPHRVPAFGEPGAVLLAAIFTLACLTTCVGLIHSISQYFRCSSASSPTGLGVCHYRCFLPDLQPRSEHHSQHFRPDPERDLSGLHRADPSGPGATASGSRTAMSIRSPSHRPCRWFALAPWGMTRAEPIGSSKSLPTAQFFPGCP